MERFYVRQKPAVAGESGRRSFLRWRPQNLGELETSAEEVSKNAKGRTSVLRDLFGWAFALLVCFAGCGAAEAALVWERGVTFKWGPARSGGRRVAWIFGCAHASSPPSCEARQYGRIRGKPFDCNASNGIGICSGRGEQGRGFSLIIWHGFRFSNLSDF